MMAETGLDPLRRGVGENEAGEPPMRGTHPGIPAGLPAANRRLAQAGSSVENEVLRR